MTQHFEVVQINDWVKINQRSNLPFYHYCIYVNHQLVATYYQGNTFYLQTGPVDHLLIVGFYMNQGQPTAIGEQFANDYPLRDRDFKPGDILVASDNVNEAMTGYMGHSAIVVDDNNLIESPGGHPAIRKDSIKQFQEKHPEHAQFRPKSLETGKAAAGYAEDYLKKYKKKLDEGIKKPVFSFDLSQSLKDPWEYIYCSKLIWLSYYYGADYEFENDYLWFSPEDLYSRLKENADFRKIYKNEKMGFQLNT